MGILFGGWAREAEEEDQWAREKGPVYYAEWKDRQLHPESYPDIVAYRKEQDKQAAKRYQYEGCAEVRIGDLICIWDKEKKQVMQEAYITNIIEGKLMVRTVSLDYYKDAHQGAEHKWVGPYAVIRK